MISKLIAIGTDKDGNLIMPTNHNKMTTEQYNEAIKYRDILELFAKCGEYVGGAEPLMDFLLFERTNRRCPSCVGAWLLETLNNIRTYERNLQGM